MKYGEYLENFLAGKSAKKIELCRYADSWLVELYSGFERKVSRKFKNFRAAKKLTNKLARKHNNAFVMYNY